MTAEVAIDQRAARAWPFLPARAVPGTVWLGPGGERVRILAGGKAEEFGEVPHQWSIGSDPCATRRAA